VVLVSALALLAPAGASGASAQATVDVYFVQGELGMTAAKRPGSGAEDAVRALLAGPTRAETSRGLETYVLARTPLRSVSVDGKGVATVDLGDRFAAGVESEDLSARLTQLVYTLTAVPGVEKVQLLIKGGVPLGLFPGYETAKPLALADVQRPTVPPPVSPGAETGTPSEAVRQLQQRLAELGFLAPDGVDGIEGEQTRFAVIAFQKWAGLSRDGVAGPATLGALASATRPAPTQPGGSGRRVEVLLDRQLALLVEGGAVVRAIHVSSGAAATPTPPGSFSIFRKEDRSWSVPFQVWLPWASYFVGGIAFHEYPDVPVVAASHGCVRVPRYDARFVYEFTSTGTPVVVAARST
jgi:hypothetical protein